MRLIWTMVLLMTFINCKTQNKQTMNTIYDFTVKDINGNDFDFSALKVKNTDCKYCIKMRIYATVRRFGSFV